MLEREPVDDDSPLLADDVRDRITLTPHIAAVSDNDACAARTRDNLDRYAREGEALIGQVDWEAGY